MVQTGTVTAGALTPPANIDCCCCNNNCCCALHISSGDGCTPAAPAPAADAEPGGAEKADSDSALAKVACKSFDAERSEEMEGADGAVAVVVDCLLLLAVAVGGVGTGIGSGAGAGADG